MIRRIPPPVQKHCVQGGISASNRGRGSSHCPPRKEVGRAPQNEGQQLPEERIKLLDAPQDGKHCTGNHADSSKNAPQESLWVTTCSGNLVFHHLSSLPPAATTQKQEEKTSFPGPLKIPEVSPVVHPNCVLLEVSDRELLRERKLLLRAATCCTHSGASTIQREDIFSMQERS